MTQGKILIVNKLDGSLLGWFGESEETRPTLDNITLVELADGQYNNDFIGCSIENIKVTDIENRILVFNPKPTQPTLEEQVEKLQQQLLQAQGVV
ncbi:hypothetical protein DU449_00070, partial [Hafnia paralvei]|uniref:hypothetical protein n=1 Tax=Hafnia paralvei TaxID=546367 RepID=UPI000E05A2B7